MPIFEYDIRMDTGISVEAADIAAAETEAGRIFGRMMVRDPENPNLDFRIDTEDGFELSDDEENDGSFEFDARLNMVIRVEADDEEVAADMASKIYKRLEIVDADKPEVSYGVDTDSSVDLMDENVDPEDLGDDEPVYKA